MKKICAFASLCTIAILFSVSAHSALINVSGPLSNLGGSAAIISAPSDVTDDAAFNTAQQGFDEVLGFSLTSNLNVDGGFISAGTTVDSHMIFLNSGPGNDRTLAEHFNVDWLFDGNILGIMSNSNGSLEVNSSSFLGAPGTIYPSIPFGARGLETNPATCNMNTNDCYVINGSTLSLTMRVTEPGDWIRVVTASKVPEPGTLLLLAMGVLGLGLSAAFKGKETSQ